MIARLAACGISAVDDGVEVRLTLLRTAVPAVRALGAVVTEWRQAVLSAEAMEVLAYLGWHGDATRRLSSRGHNTRMAMFEELVLLVEATGSTTMHPTELAALELKEREHLQEWVLKHPRVLGDGVRVITSEYDRWQSALGDPVRDRLDVLGLAPDGRLVVAELKRGKAPHTVHMQAVNYAAMVSRLTTRDVAELYAEDRRKHGGTVEVEAALAEFESGYLLTEETIRNPRIVLIAEEFPASVTASVVWLNERAVDISLVRYRPYRLPAGELIVAFSRFYPVPTVEEFTIGRFHPADSGDIEPSPVVPWDEAALTRLANLGNPATITLLDLCSSSAEPITIHDIEVQTGLKPGQVRGQLAGFTMLLRNPKNGFAQSSWPVQVAWLAGGYASYTMPAELREVWQTARSLRQPSEVAPEMESDGIPIGHPSGRGENDGALPVPSAIPDSQASEGPSVEEHEG